MELSLGVRFDPTDEQLIKGFLRKRLRGENLPHYYIKECRIYDKEPWLIFNKDIKQIHYVFVQLIKKSGKMIQRTAGNGTWKGENNVEVKDEQGRVIGSKKLLTFQHDCVDNGRWVMHEYSIDKNDLIVVCAIRNRELDNVEQASAVMDFDGFFGARNQQLIERVENGVTENIRVNPSEVAGTSGSNLCITAWEAHEDPILPLGDATDSIFSECTPINAIGTLEEDHFPANTFNVNTGELAGTSGSNLCGIEWEGQGNPVLQLANSAACFLGECTPMSAIGSSSEEEHFADTFNGDNIQQGSLAMDFEGMLGVQEIANQQYWTEENGIENFECPSLQHPPNVQVNPGEVSGTLASNLYGEGFGDPILPLGNAPYNSLFIECTSLSAIGTSLEESHNPADNFNGCNNVTTELGFQASEPERERETNHTRLDLSSDYNPNKRCRPTSCVSSYKRRGLSNV